MGEESAPSKYTALHPDAKERSNGTVNNDGYARVCGEATRDDCLPETQRAEAVLLLSPGRLTT